MEVRLCHSTFVAMLLHTPAQRLLIVDRQEGWLYMLAWASITAREIMTDSIASRRIQEQILPFRLAGMSPGRVLCAVLVQS